MSRLEKVFSRKGDRGNAAGRRAAAAAGIHPDTWVRWKRGGRKPGAASLAKLERAFNRLVTVPEFRRTLKKKGVPNRVRVTADIKWSKSPKNMYNRNKHRTTTLESMRPTMAAVIRAWATAGPEAAADVLERGTAQNYSSAEVKFEGDDVTIEFPEGEH